MRTALLACLLAAPAAAVGFEEQLGAFKPSFALLRTAYQESQQAAQAFNPNVAVIPLAQIHNNLLRGYISFQVDGRTVKLVGTKTQNTKEWFVGFIKDDGSTWFYKGKKALYAPNKVVGVIGNIMGGSSMNNHLILEFYGKLYDFQLLAELGNVANRTKSPLAITPVEMLPGKSRPTDRRPTIDEVRATGPRRQIGTVQDLVDAANRVGHDLTVGGTAYKIFYTDGIIEDRYGEYGGLSGDQSVAFLYNDRAGKPAGFHWFLRDIPQGRLAVGERKDARGTVTSGNRQIIKGGVDNCKPGPLFALMRRPDGDLEIRQMQPFPDFAKYEKEGKQVNVDPACVAITGDL